MSDVMFETPAVVLVPIPTPTSPTSWSRAWPRRPTSPCSRCRTARGGETSPPPTSRSGDRAREGIRPRRASSRAITSASSHARPTSGRSSISRSSTRAPSWCPSTRRARPRRSSGSLSDSGATACLVESTTHAERVEEVRGHSPSSAASGRWRRAMSTHSCPRAPASPTKRSPVVAASRGARMSRRSSTLRVRPGARRLRAHARELRRPRPQLRRRAPGGARGRERLDAPVHHDGARLRPFISILDVHAASRRGISPTRSNSCRRSARSARRSSWPSRASSRRSTTSAEQKAEAGGRGRIFRRAADVAVRRSTLEQEGTRIPFGPGSSSLCSTVSSTANCARRWAPGDLRDLRLGPARTTTGALLPQPGSHDLEGYGLTETTAPATVNRRRSPRSAPWAPCSPESASGSRTTGEIQVRGINVFKEYWRNPEATAGGVRRGVVHDGRHRAFDDDGSSRSRVARRRSLSRREARTSPPPCWRTPSRADPIVGQVVVVGDQKPFIAALVTPRPRDAADVACQQRTPRGHDARRRRAQRARARRGAAGDRSRQQARLPGGVRSASSRSCRASGRRPADTSRRSSASNGPYPGGLRPRDRGALPRSGLDEHHPP